MYADFSLRTLSVAVVVVDCENLSVVPRQETDDCEERLQNNLFRVDCDVNP